MRLLLATENPGKIAQIRESLEGIPIPITTCSEMGFSFPVVEENGTTVEENARLKARAYAESAARAGYRDVVVLADDGGVFIDALGGEPGVRAKRWCGQDNPDDATVIAYTLKRMDGIPWEARTARFRVAQVALFPDGTEELCTGITEGRIMETVRKNRVPGLPYGALLWVDAVQKVYDDLTVEERATFTHREKALHKIRASLLCWIQNTSENTVRR